jgi:hypothetical protein
MGAESLIKWVAVGARGYDVLEEENTNVFSLQSHSAVNVMEVCGGEGVGIGEGGKSR